MPLMALYVGSAALQFVAAWVSFSFVWTRRLGRVWLLASVALLLKGLLSVWAAAFVPDDSTAISALQIPAAEFFISLLLAAGFLLTGEWFRFKERLEARFELIAEVERSLVGVLEEDRIYSLVCGILSRRHGYRLAWVGVAVPDGSVRVEHGAGVAERFLSEAAFRWDDTPEGRTPPGKSLRTGETCVRKGRPRKGDPDAFRGRSLRHGLEGCMSARIDRAGPPHRVLTVHADRSVAFDAGEVLAFAAMAGRVGAAIESARRHLTFVNAKSSYDELLRNQRDGVLLVRGGKVVRANPAAATMLGYSSPDELYDADPASIVANPEAHPGIREALRGPGGIGTRNEWETDLLRRDGTAFAGEIAATWISREDRRTDFVPALGGPLGMMLLRDVTHRVRTLSELRRERDFSERILDIAGALVLQVGPGGEILLFNRQCEETTEWTAAEARGTRMPELLVPEPLRAVHYAAVEAVLAGRTPPPLETKIRAARGQERMIAWKYAPLRDDEGKVSSVIVTGIDVTERRLLEKQIIEMQKMEAVGTLAGGIAHDFNNILTGILGSLDIARRGIPAGSPAAAPVAESIRAAERAVQLVRQLLDFSRRSPSEQRPVNLGPVVREAVALFSQTIDRRIEVTSSIEEGLSLALADPNQVHQVLMNLCINARDAILESLEAPEKPGSHPLTGYWIYVRAENVLVDDEYCRIFPYARKGRFIRLSIGDNGAGMDEARQHRVFEPFFTTKKMGRGTGLGLSTVYGIVKQHNGWINLESRPGKGTTFCAYFPQAVGAAEEAAPAAEPARPLLGRERVLFVDDEHLIRELARMVLESYGYTVYLAADGQEAIEWYEANRERVDVVVLDLTMPHRSGIEVLRHIRSVDPAAKVILSSGNMPNEDIGKTAFLAKPYRADALARIVRTVLDAEPIA